LYASLILLGFGIFFKQITIETTALVLFNFFALIATAKQEEKEMLIKFGEDYHAYMKRTKMFIPYIF
jgi:protein-S-isoprenylcysteine O-methyltransferase Ste14